MLKSFELLCLKSKGIYKLSSLEII